MNRKDHLLRMAQVYGEALGLPQTTVSWRLFEDTNKLANLEAGRDLYLGRYERALQFLSDTWPSGLDWPADVPRPERSVGAHPDPAPAEGAVS